MRKSRNLAVFVAVLALAAPSALALPGPLRLAAADAKPVPQKATQRTTQDYTANAALNDLFEVAAARLALQRSHSAEVRKFATLMIDAHTMLARNLEMTVTSASVPVDLPKALDAAHVEMIDQLGRSATSEFDTRYIQQRVDAHHLALDLHQSYARRGDNDALKRFAADAQTLIAMHLAEAEKVSHSLAGLQPRA